MRLLPSWRQRMPSLQFAGWILLSARRAPPLPTSHPPFPWMGMDTQDVAEHLQLTVEKSSHCVRCTSVPTVSAI